jgi:hypothetical protein
MWWVGDLTPCMAFQKAVSSSLTLSKMMIIYIFANLSQVSEDIIRFWALNHSPWWWLWDIGSFFFMSSMQSISELDMATSLKPNESRINTPNQTLKPYM